MVVASHAMVEFKEEEMKDEEMKDKDKDEDKREGEDEIALTTLTVSQPPHMEASLTVVQPISSNPEPDYYPKVKPGYSNTFAAKKSVAQGMMDIALITANANQLRYLLEYSRASPTFEVNVTLIVISLIIQIAVGVSLIFKGRYDMAGAAKREYANRINNYVVVGVFMVTIINVFVAAFSISAAPPPQHYTAPAIAAPPAPAMAG